MIADINVVYLISALPTIFLATPPKEATATRSHPEMVGDMSRVTLN